ncbi:MAG TPA: type II toxin-antitoxin system HicA family toxin [Pyrinomonadaceae bacterium]|nr:type II toxin-antitoxin system HicA family toxin [Pyrinomonadaceae bacterium]
MIAPPGKRELRFSAMWSIKRESSSHKILSRPGWSDVVFAFHDKDEIGPKMLARMVKHTGLELKDL